MLLRINQYFTFILLVFLAQSCEPDFNSFIEVNANKMINLYSNNKEIEADGISMSKITVSLPSNIDRRSVSLKTSHGHFDISNKNDCTLNLRFINDSLQACVNVISDLEAREYVIIEATMDQFFTYDTIKFITSFPDTLLLNCEAPTLNSGLNSTMKLKVILLCNIGLPSIGQRIELTARRIDTGDFIGKFEGKQLITGTSSEGIIEGVFELRDSVYQGIVEIRAFMASNTKTIEDVYQIYITK